jgi:hypothetical protein
MTDFALTERGLWIPPSATIHRQKPIGRCRVPVNDEGKPCNHPFFPGEERAMTTHIAACTKRHLDVIHRYRQRTHPDIMRPWDGELKAWVDKHSEAILEGRKRLGGGVT